MKISPPAEFPEVMNAAGAEDGIRISELGPPVHAELRWIARRHLRNENNPAALKTSSLVHEAYLRMAAASDLRLQDRSHLLVVAAKLMRRILIDHARSRARVKRFGGAAQVPLEDALA